MSTAYLITMLLLAVCLIVFLVAKLNLHAFIALVLATFFLGLGTGMPLKEIIIQIESGVGGTLGFLALIIGFGSILGKMLEVSGGAERIATTLLDKLGERNATWVMMLVGYLAGIPVFCDVGFFLLVPLVFVVAKETGMSNVLVGVPLMLSLMTIHCILPPHPAATAISVILGADLGTVIVLGLIVGLPATILGGPVYMGLCRRKEISALKASNWGKIQGAKKKIYSDKAALPPFGITIFTILLPLFLMVGNTLLSAFFTEGGAILQIVQFVGNPVTSLLISAFFAYWALGLRRGVRADELLKITDASFMPIAGIILIIGAGGGFNAIIMASGIGKSLADSLSTLPVSPIVLAWLVAGILHFAVGSATVAMMSAAAIVLPMLQANPNLSPELMVLAVGSGTIGWTQLTDSGFWLVREYFKLPLMDTIKTYSVATSIASIVGLGMTMLISLFI